jgi:hypothetical protein
VLNYLSTTSWRHTGSGGIALSFSTSELDGDEWSASRPGPFITGERARGTHWLGGWVGLLALPGITRHYIDWAIPAPTVLPFFSVLVPTCTLVNKLNWITRSRDSSVGIATELLTGRSRNRVFIPSRSRRISYPESTDRLWGPPSLPSKGDRGLLPRG